MAKGARQGSKGNSPQSAASYVRRSVAAVRARPTVVCPRRWPERAALIEWAVRGEKVLEPSCRESFRSVASGAEHVVFHDAKRGRATKVTYPNCYGHSAHAEGCGATPLEYLRRLSWHNILFGDDIRIEGVIYDEDQLEVVTSQPWIYSGNRPVPTQGQIDDYFAGVGFEPVPLFPFAPLYYSEALRILVADAHDRNLLVDEAGNLVPIDLVIGVPSIQLENQVRACLKLPPYLL